MTSPTFTRIRGEGFRLLPARDLIALCAIAGFVWTTCTVVHRFMGAM